MITWLEDMVDSASGIVNFILCVIIAGILTVAIMILLASITALWIKSGVIT